MINKQVFSTFPLRKFFSNPVVEEESWGVCFFFLGAPPPVPAMYGSWLWLCAQFVRGEAGDEAFQPLFSFLSPEFVTSLLEYVQFPLNVKETIFLLFNLVTFLYTICSFYRIRAEISRGSDETLDLAVEPSVRNPE